MNFYDEVLKIQLNTRLKRGVDAPNSIFFAELVNKNNYKIFTSDELLKIPAFDENQFCFFDTLKSKFGLVRKSKRGEILEFSLSRIFKRDPLILDLSFSKVFSEKNLYQISKSIRFVEKTDMEKILIETYFKRSKETKNIPEIMRMVNGTTKEKLQKFINDYPELLLKFA